MPFITLPNGLDADIYNLFDKWESIQKQVIANAPHPRNNIEARKKIREANRKMSKQYNGKTKTPFIINNNYNNDNNNNNNNNKFDMDDEEIKELLALPSLFPVNTSNLRFESPENEMDDRDSQISDISDLSGIVNVAVDHISIPENKEDDKEKEKEKEEEEEENNEEEESDSQFPDLPWSQMISGLNGVDENIILSQRGYTRVRTISETLQGEIIECIKVETPTTETNDGNNDNDNDKENNIKHVAIKKTNKRLWKQKVSKEDEFGMSFCIEDDILKQALILHHLSVDNTSSGDYIIKYIEFFESYKDFYLVMEYIEDDMNLKNFVEKAHEYINDGKLSLKEYQHFVKYILWQISAVIHWLHDDMHCCHGSLCLENILLKNAHFIEKTDGTVTINNAVSVKLCDFGRGEVFKVNEETADDSNNNNNNTTNTADDGEIDDGEIDEEFDEMDSLQNNINPFLCQKQALFYQNVQYLSPKLYDGDVYDARKADIWAMGMILYECVIGKPLYKRRNIDIIDGKYDKTKVGSGYWSIEQKQITLFLAMNGLTKYVNKKILSLLNGLLDIDENKRFNSMEILKHEWFKCYYKSYKQRIDKKSETQRQKLSEQSTKMDNFPYYTF